MESTQIIALSREAALRRQMDVVANNIANMNTTGFKGEQMMFVQHLVRSKGGNGLTTPTLAYVRDIATMTDMHEGALKTTGNPLDVAITGGPGFFVVQTPQGQQHYTRNGRFQLDKTGKLVTAEGDAVLSTNNQPIYFAPTDERIAIASDGTISTNNGTTNNNNSIAQLQVVKFANPQRLKHMGGAQFSTNSNNPPQAVTNVHIVQGALEGSNVQPIYEMARMIDVHRTYDAVRQFIDREDSRERNMIQVMGQTA